MDIIGKKIKILLAERNIKQQALIEVLGLSSKQALSNKFAKGSWSASELAKIAAYCNAEYCFVIDKMKLDLKE